MVTQQDVARLAGTSTAVVSYVLNNGPRPVAPATRDRVLQAVAELRYRPNAAARALSRRKDDLVGLVVPNFRNPFFGMLATAIEETARNRGFTVVVGTAQHDDDRQAEYIGTFVGRQAAGLILVGTGQEESASIGPATTAVLVAERGIPLVSTDPLPRGSAGLSLLPDNRAGAINAVEHLLGHGHRSIAMLAGPSGFQAVQERVEGWQATLTAADVDSGRQIVLRSRFDRYEASRLMLAELERGSRFEAIFVHTDEQALGVLHAAAVAGLRIPHDLAIVSFDGIDEAELVTPGLTTIIQSISTYGDLAIDAIERQTHKPLDRRQVRRVATTLKVRESCGCATRTKERSSSHP